MEKMDVVIIGGGPAGITCAISTHNTYPDKSIAVIRSLPVSLIPCGIPYAMHTLQSVDEDILPDAPLKKIGARLIIDEVVGHEDKVLLLKSGERIVFEKLVLATGSTPLLPPIAGVEKDGVYVVTKDREALKVMRDRAEASSRVVVIGGGYIGVEIADEIRKAGKNVTLIEMQTQLLPVSMDSEFGEKAAEVLMTSGVEVLRNCRVDSFEGDESVRGVVLADGTVIDADMVIVSVGCKPNTVLAEKIGLEYDSRFGISVDEYLRTSDKDIFAIGDCAAKHDFFTGEYSPVMLASTAMAEGRLVGSNLFQIKVLRKYTGVLGSFSTKIDGIAFGVSGITERKAKSMGLDYVVGEATTVDRHPGKLPGGSQMHLKLVYARYSHTLLGAQMFGGDSVGELVNMFSVMILNKMTDMEIDNLQIGTHPMLTASPIAYPVITATVDAIRKWYPSNAA